MRILPVSALCLSLVLVATTGAQETNLTRSEVAAIKAKLVAVQQAMGADPAGYVRKEEDSFSLPTEFQPNQQQAGKYWPITSSVQMRFTDRGVVEGAADIQKLQEEFQAKYAAALASGNVETITKMVEEMTRLQTAAVGAAMAPAAKKLDMQIAVQLNMNPSVGIDPDAVVLEQPGVIALRDRDGTDGKGSVTVYIDPVALKDTQELSKIELRTDDEGVGNKTGVFHVVIRLDGALTDIESWVQSFDFGAMLAVIDSR